MELVDYITNTPQNTNKTILKQLINGEKNKAVYESVEELKNGGSVGYTETNTKEILPPTECILNDEEIASFAQVVEGNVAFEVGKTYTVVYNGERFTMVARKHPDTEMTVVGALDEEEFSAYPIMVGTGYDTKHDATAIFFLWAPIEFSPDGEMIFEKHESLTLAIYEVIEIIHPINPKFLPKGSVGYSENKTVAVVPETTLSFASTEEFPIPMAMITLPIEPMKTYEVMWDGTPYTVTADVYGNIGNKALSGEEVEDTGEPFVYAGAGVMIATTEGNHTFFIIGEVEEVHAIDKKYIPWVNDEYCSLPFVDLTKETFKLNSSPSSISADSPVMEILSKLYYTRTPFVGRLKFYNDDVVALFSFSTDKDSNYSCCYSAVFNQYARIYLIGLCASHSGNWLYEIKEVL